MILILYILKGYFMMIACSYFNCSLNAQVRFFMIFIYTKFCLINQSLNLNKCLKDLSLLRQIYYQKCKKERIMCIKDIIFQQYCMRLQFELKKIKIDPVCHLQILRHAEEFQHHNNIYGQLYGALLDDEAEVTSVMPLPDGEKSTKEELEGMQKRNDELLSNFNLDSEKIGWYLVCYTRNFWDSLETIKYYENYINTSFFLVFDYKGRLQGKNPYRAFRLKDQFALKENFKWEDLQKTNLDTDNPFQQIPVQVQKNQLFQLMMLFNKDAFLKKFAANRKKETKAYGKIKQNIDEYLMAFEERDQIQKYFNENYLKNNEGSTKPQQQKEKQIPFNDYCQYIGQALKLDNYQRHFKQYLEDNQHYTKLFEQGQQ